MHRTPSAVHVHVSAAQLIPDEDVADVHRRPVRLELDRPGRRQRLALGEEVGQRLILDDGLPVEQDRDAVALHADAGGVPLPDGLVRLHERKPARRVGGVIPQTSRTLLAAVLEVALAGRVPNLDLRMAAEIDAAVGTRLRQHPFEQEFEVAEVAIGGQEHAMTVADDQNGDLTSVGVLRAVRDAFSSQLALG